MSSNSDEQHIEIGIEKLTPNRDLAKAEESTQLQERRIRARAGLGIRPPYNPDRLAAFLELNETHAAAVRKKGRYEVGFGFDIVPHDTVDSEDADEGERDLVEDFWHSPETKWQTGPNQSAEPTTPIEVLELARQDYHNIGWLCIEVLVNNAGDPVGLAYVPANTVRVRKPPADDDDVQMPSDLEMNQRGYVQMRQGRRRFFGEAGDRYRGEAADDDQDPIFVDAENGDVVTGSAQNVDNEPANELIFVRNPSPLADHYGVPDWISSLRTISADEAAKDYNRQFFQNDTVPRMVVKVTGGELSEESKRDLRQMVHGLKEENHRTVVLELEKFADKIGADDLEIELEPIGQGVTEEMSFEAFREKNEHDIAKAHEVPPVKIGVTETSNRSNSRAQEREFAIEVIHPEQKKFAERLYRIIHQQALGVTDWTLEFELRGADQPAEEARLAEQRVRAMRLAGVGTVNEAREELDLDSLDEPLGSMTLAEFEVEFQGGSAQQPGGGGERLEDAPPPENQVGTRATIPLELAEKQGVETAQFDSSNLDQGLYDAEEEELYIRFKRDDGADSLYVYLGAPEEEWQGLVSADSHGSYHYENIRLDYAYEEITDNHTPLPDGPDTNPEDVPEGI